MSNTNITIDIARGVDVLRNGKLVEHFDGADALAAAWRCVRQGRGRYVRYWAVKEGK